eukprot:scaffold1800_cov387-Prasinococcus_capsulatus_cf.AAC.4
MAPALATTVWEQDQRAAAAALVSGVGRAHTLARDDAFDLAGGSHLTCAEFVSGWARRHLPRGPLD